MTGPACLAQLSTDGVGFRSLPPPSNPHPCGIDTAVRVESLESAYLNKPVLMGCGVADTLGRWEREVVEPAARRYFGQGVREVTSYGAYYCRQEVGSGRNYVSMHSYGLTIDVGGWTLDNGAVINVGHDWTAGGPREAFLHAIAEGACRYFSVVLTPSANAARQNHFHLDIGRYHYCGSGKE